MFHIVSFILQKVAHDQLLDRMTDTSAYTGTHKLRFDESGKGKGLEGRDSVPKGLGYHAPLVSAQPSYVTGNLIGLDAVDSAREQEKAKSHAAQASPRSGGSKKVATSSPRPSASKTTAQSSPKPTSTTAKSSPRPTKTTTTSSPRVQSKTASSSAAKASPKLPAQSKAKTTVATSSPKASPKAKPKVCMICTCTIIIICIYVYVCEPCVNFFVQVIHGWGMYWPGMNITIPVSNSPIYDMLACDECKCCALHFRATSMTD